METNTGRTLTALVTVALITTLVGASLTGCSPLDDSQTFSPSDTARSSTTLTGPASS